MSARCEVREVSPDTLLIRPSTGADGVLAAEVVPFLTGRYAQVLLEFPTQLQLDPAPLLSGIARVLVPDGEITLTDHVVPGTLLRGKKRRRTAAAARYINAAARLRYAGHRRWLSTVAWQNHLAGAGFAVMQIQESRRPVRLPLSLRGLTRDEIRLRAMIIQAPPDAAAFLTPEMANDRITYYETTAAITGRLTSRRADSG